MNAVAHRSDNVVWLRISRLFGRRPRITDGDMELRVTYELYQILSTVPPSSRDRALKHVRDIFNEQAEALGEYQFEE